MPDPPVSRTPSRRPRGLELLALTSLAIAQPIFDVVSRESGYFVAHDSGPADLVLFAAIVYLAPPLLLGLAAYGLGRAVPALGTRNHATLVALLFALMLLPPLVRSGLSGAVAFPVALLTGGLLSFGLERLPALGSFLAILSPLTLAFPLLFLFASPANDLLRAETVRALEVDIPRPAPIVFLLLDELPVVSLLDDRREIDAELFPNFARLAASSYWFRNATTVSHDTNYAVAALLTGRYPDRRRPPIAREYPRSLFTLLGSVYSLDVSETQTRLCPAALCGTPEDRLPLFARLRRLLADTGVVYLHIALPSELSGGLPAVTATWADFNAVAPADLGAGSIDLPHLHTVDRARVFHRFVDRLMPGEEAPGEGPTLHFLHVMLPHIPWAYLPSGKEYWASLSSSAFAEGVAPDSTWTDEPWLVAQGYQRHLLQVAFVDRLLGRLLDRMAETGLDERAVLIVAADHGLSFLPGQPGRKVTEENYADIMAVPLFVRTPGQVEGRIDDRNVELIDVLPTIAELLGVDLPFEVDGDSVFDTGPQRTRKVLRTEPPEGITFETAELDSRYRSLERKLELFADGLYSIGPHHELIGLPVSELTLGEPLPVEVRLDQPEHFRQVDLSGSYIPAHIFGRARWPGPPEHLDLAIGVNGIVRAVTRTFDDRGGERFAVMVPEDSFVEGENAIEVYVVDSGDDGLVAHPTRRNAAPRYTLDVDAEGRVTRLVASDGTTCSIDPGAVEGGLMREGTGHLGWARDPTGSRPHLVILVFADGRLVHTTTTGGAPPATSPVAGQVAFETAGFRFNLPAGLVEATDDLRVFAVVGERGAELLEAGSIQTTR